MEKLIVVIMGQNCEKFIKMSLESVKSADAIVYCDGGSTDKTIDYLISEGFHRRNHHREESIELREGWLQKWIIHQDYNQQDKQMNGKQRNFYLNFLKEYYPNDWALCIDADEVVEDIDLIKQFIQKAKPGLYCPKMRHFQQDLGHEDATVKEHWVLNRLFKISNAGEYPLVEHPVLQPNNGQNEWWNVNFTTIWHLAYIPNLWDIKKRYDSHMKKSEMHTPEFLKWWYRAHLFGVYPKSEIKLIEIPEIILKEFGIDKDEIYFSERGIEVKHPLMVQQWNAHFKPKSVLDLGCGRGPFLFFWKWFVPASWGIDISPYAVKNGFVPTILEGNIADPEMYSEYDLIMAFDVLEHLTDEELDKTLWNISSNGQNFLFSIPFIGDPNLDNDKTHKQRRTKEEWIKIIEAHGIKIEETPKEWLFAHQILVGTK